MLNHIKASNPHYAQKQILDLLNAARNFFKHDGESLDDTIEFSDEMNDFALFSACHDCMLCTPNQPPEVQAYGVWFIAVKDGPNQTDSEIAAELNTRFPNLRNTTRVEQKCVGRKLLDEAQHMMMQAKYGQRGG
jgi:hypothetical protein